MFQIKNLRKAKTAVALEKRAAAVFIYGAEKGETNIFLLFRHYFCLLFAEWPVAVVVIGRTAKLWTFFRRAAA